MPLLPLPLKGNQTKTFSAMETQTLTFDQLPQAVHRFGLQLEELKRLVLNMSGQQVQQEQQDIIMDVQDAAKFLKLSVPTIYSKTSRGELPAMKRGKRLYFSRLDLMAYLKEGRSSTIDEMAQEYLNGKSKRR
jgi:excisionase family DNA binding protein